MPHPGLITLVGFLPPYLLSSSFQPFLTASTVRPFWTAEQARILFLRLLPRVWDALNTSFGVHSVFVLRMANCCQ